MWEWLITPFNGARARFTLFYQWLFLALVWNTGVAVIFSPHLDREDVFDPTLEGWIGLPIIAGLVLVEEAVRLTPLALAVLLFGRNAIVTLAVAVVTAAAFGAAHVGNGLPLWFTLIAQGVTGFIMNLLYLKGGGLQGRTIAAFFYAYAFHVAYDWILFAVVLLGRGT